MEKTQLFSLDITFEKEDFDDVNLKPFSIMQKFQTIATSHAENLGLDYHSMLKKNLLWITMRIKYKIDKMPASGQKLVLKTYPLAKNMIEFDRDFLIETENGEILIRGTSKWCLIDKDTRKLCRMSSIDYDFENVYGTAFEGKFLKTDTFVPEFAPDYSYQVIDSDIDVNGHMNNTMYSKIIGNFIKHNGKKIEEYQVNFLKEAFLGNRIDVYIKKDGNNLNILGKLCEGENCFSAYITYQK